MTPGCSPMSPASPGEECREQAMTRQPARRILLGELQSKPSIGAGDQDGVHANRS